jgi:thiol-disulfide isomerase/thioredoxin
MPVVQTSWYRKVLKCGWNEDSMRYQWFIVIVLVAGCLGQGPVSPEEYESQSGSSEPQPYIDLTDDQILELIDQNAPVILYFYAPTCSTCLTVKPLLEELQVEYGLDIIWVDKLTNKHIFELYHLFYYPALYVSSDSEVLFTFGENDSLTRLYAQILDETIAGMHEIEYTIEDGQIVVPTDDVQLETLYYLDYETHRLFIFISAAAQLYIFSGSETCETNWLYLKKDLIHDGENKAQWERDTLIKHGGGCGELVLVPHDITGSAIIIAIENVR